MTSLSQRRQQILDEMARLDRLQRGYLSKQFFTRERGGRTLRFGPYYVLQHGAKERRVCRRVPADEVNSVEADLAAWRCFEKLAEEFVEVTERMTLASESDAESKKKARSSLRRAVRKPKGF